MDRISSSSEESVEIPGDMQRYLNLEEEFDFLKNSEPVQQQLSEDVFLRQKEMQIAVVRNPVFNIPPHHPKMELIKEEESFEVDCQFDDGHMSSLQFTKKLRQNITFSNDNRELIIENEVAREQNVESQKKESSSRQPRIFMRLPKRPISEFFDNFNDESDKLQTIDRRPGFQIIETPKDRCAISRQTPSTDVKASIPNCVAEEQLIRNENVVKTTHFEFGSVKINHPRSEAELREYSHHKGYKKEIESAFKRPLIAPTPRNIKSKRNQVHLTRQNSSILVPHKGKKDEQTKLQEIARIEHFCGGLTSLDQELLGKTIASEKTVKPVLKKRSQLILNKVSYKALSNDKIKRKIRANENMEQSSFIAVTPRIRKDDLKRTKVMHFKQKSFATFDFDKQHNDNNPTKTLIFDRRDVSDRWNVYQKFTKSPISKPQLSTPFKNDKLSKRDPETNRNATNLPPKCLKPSQELSVSTKNITIVESANFDNLNRKFDKENNNVGNFKEKRQIWRNLINRRSKECKSPLFGSFVQVSQNQLSECKKQREKNLHSSHQKDTENMFVTPVQTKSQRPVITLLEGLFKRVKKTPVSTLGKQH